MLTLVIGGLSLVPLVHFMVKYNAYFRVVPVAGVEYYGLLWIPVIVAV